MKLDLRPRSGTPASRRQAACFEGNQTVCQARALLNGVPQLRATKCARLPRIPTFHA
jgi:hypothetical protein